ncbi:DUF4815 domain-containing protein [Crocinitomicaceae bacterium]|nr:DUF4815 domain-containing protein [Crocinitomicaceae bacterium]
MPSPTDFNLSPYYDDFNESKKFHRILFRPSFAVQARELTQSQTILQNQIERVGDHLFKQGAMIIPGQVSIDTSYYAVKLTSLGSGNTLAQFTTGTILTGGTSGVTAEIVNTVATDGTDPDTIFVKYNKTGTDNADLVFADGESLTGTNSDSVSLSAVVDTTATGSAAGVQSGTYYINGFFVQVDTSTLILDKYTNTPSYRIGFTVTESFVTPNDDASLNDNAAGSSNVNAPGAHRFKILLTLAKKTLASTEDENFYEIARVENGNIKSIVRNTEYAILEDTLARRTFDESGDYVLTNPDFDVREHLVSGNNRGIYTSGNGGDAAKLAIGLSPFKAYVKGYEAERLGTTFVDVDKARDFETANNHKTRFNVKNFINVTNVYGSPDVGFVSGEVEAFKTVNLYDTATSVRGTEQNTVGTTVPQIGRAKSRGFETVSATESLDINATSSIYRHYLFDIEMFTHLNALGTASYTTGEIVSGATSAATGVVQSITATKNTAVTSISVASPGVVTLNDHGINDGQQVYLTGGTWQIDSSATNDATAYTARNTTTNTFELYASDGTTAVNVTSFSGAPTLEHTTIVVSNLEGTFSAGETVTGQTSNSSLTLQSDALGFKAVRTRDVTAVKQIGMAGSPTYTADADLTSTYGTNTTIIGNVSIANSDATLLGKGTNFTTDIKIGDSISFINDAGNTVTGLVKYVVSQTELELTANVGGSDVTTASVVTIKRAKLTNPENNISIFNLPHTTVKTLKTTANGGASDTSYNVRRQFTITLSSNGDETISAGTNETFAAFAADDFTATIMTTGAGGTGAVGDVLNLSGNNHEGDPILELGGSPVGKTLKFDFGANFQGHRIKILATVQRTTVSNSKSKALNSNSTVAISSQSIIESGVIGLGKADVYQINNVYMSSGFGAAATSGDTDITSRFDLDNGQRDNYYDIGRLKLKPGSIRPTGQLLVDFDFFSHGSGDHFDVDSYSGVIDYENIPSYTSDTTGNRFELRDCLDFRPRVDDASTINSGSSDRSFDGAGASTVDVIQFNSDATTDFEYYLNRIDKIFITRQGELKVLKGASALNPLEPGNLDGHLLLATLTIPSYTLNTDSVIVDKEDNSRYTMRDIGRLENRIKNIEYYTQLSLLEADAQSLQIQDADGFDRFKNGFVVDNFSGHNVGDVGNNDYKLSIDRARGEARTPFNEDVIELTEVDDDLTSILAADRTAANYAKTGDLITLPYTETTYLQQPYATKTENLNPFLVFDWIGDITLDPPVDEWKETRVAPELVVNVNGTFDNLLRERGLSNNSQEIPVGTEWNEWQDQWSGNPRSSNRWQGNSLVQTTSRDVVQTRAGVRTTIVPQTVRQSLGNRVVSVAFVPFIRSRTLTFTAQGMRPNTRVYPFFDNIDISSYITPNGGSLGGNIITDANGSVTGTFAIPDPNVSSNPRWRTGKRIFRLTASSTNSEDRTAVATSGEADYDAKGLLETTQEAIVSTREARTVRSSVTSNRSTTRTASRVIAQRNQGGGGGGDPLAQSFMIDEEDGIFITSLDAFFATKSDTIPVRAEIRNMVNGYPGQKVIPFAQKYLNPSSVNTSTDGSTATTFTFDSPVYLQEGIEYCIVLYSDSTDYTAYIARLGDKTIDSDRTVSKQPASGVLFKSANYRTWTPEQMEDMKFTLKKAVFDTSASGTLTLANNSLPVKTLDNNPIRTFNGSGVVRVFHKNHGMHSTTDNVIIAGITAGTYNGIAHSDINGTYTSISNITLDSYDVTTSGTATATGDVGGSTVTATQNRLFDVLQPQIGHVVHPATTLTSTLRTTTGKSVHGSETAFSLQGATAAENIVLGDNYYFDNPRMVASDINQSDVMSSAKSLVMNLTMSSTNANLSPVIDLKRVNAFAISNRLNNPTVSFTDTFTGDGSTTDFTLSGTPTSVHLLSVKKDGKKLQPVDDFTVSGTTLTLDTAPASGSKVIAKLTNTVDYEDDTATEGGSSAGAYITKPVNLANASTALDVRLAASVRSTSSIKCFFRLSGGEETRRIEDIPFTPFNTDGSSDVTVDPSNGDVVLDLDFKDYKFSASALPEFTSFQIKIVFNGTVSALPARLKDFRTIALAV